MKPPRGVNRGSLREGRIAVLGGSLRSRHAVVALLLYVATAVVFQFHAVAHLGGTCACIGTDPTMFMWSLVWWPHALLHGINPLVTHLIWVPDSINLAANTSIPGPALLAAPLTAVAGPIVSYNVLMLLAPVTGAWCAYRLCLYLTRKPAASILGGYLFGFSTYGLGQLEGHLQLVFTFAAPAAALLTLKRLDGVISARRYLLLLALVLIAQLLCGTEMLFTLTCLGVVALAAGWIFSSAARRRRIIAILPPLAGAYVLMAVLCAPFLYYALTGPQVAADRGLDFPADALSFIIPTALMRLGGSRFAAVSGAFEAGFVETGTYLGLPVIIIVAAFAVQRWRTRAANILLSILAVAVVWSLGEKLNIDGHATIPLPWKLVGNLRTLNELLPVRIGVYIFLVSAVIAALWLATPVPARRRRWLLAMLAVVFLIPNTALFNQPVAVPAFFTTNLYRRYLRPNEIVLPIPYAIEGFSLLWQARTGMYFRLASGDFYVPANYLNEAFVQETLEGASMTPAGAALRMFIVKHHVSAVVVEAAQPGPWPGVLASLGYSGVNVGGVVLYRVAPA